MTKPNRLKTRDEILKHHKRHMDQKMAKHVKKQEQHMQTLKILQPSLMIWNQRFQAQRNTQVKQVKQEQQVPQVQQAKQKKKDLNERLNTNETNLDALAFLALKY